MYRAQGSLNPVNMQSVRTDKENASNPNMLGRNMCYKDNTKGIGAVYSGSPSSVVRHSRLFYNWKTFTTQRKELRRDNATSHQGTSWSYPQKENLHCHQGSVDPEGKRRYPKDGEGYHHPDSLHPRYLNSGSGAPSGERCVSSFHGRIMNMSFSVRQCLMTLIILMYIFKVNELMDPQSLETLTGIANDKHSLNCTSEESEGSKVEYIGTQLLQHSRLHGNLADYDKINYMQDKRHARCLDSIAVCTQKSVHFR